MYTRMTIEVTTVAGVVVDHRLIAHEQPAGLLVLLPGRGYTRDHPCRIICAKPPPTSATTC
ncbi:MAG: hypothetical protein U0703_27645 [Anaerolineae bacterium]